MERTLYLALYELYLWAYRLHEKLVPDVPLPRPKKISFTPRISWPGEKGFHCVNIVRKDGRRISFYFFDGVRCEKLARIIFQDTGGDPERVAETLKKIEEATEWCKKRIEGRKRASSEILRQQGKALRKLNPADLKGSCQNLIFNALRNLALATEKLNGNLRPKYFFFSPGVYWPGQEGFGSVTVIYEWGKRGNESLYSKNCLKELASRIVKDLGGQPSKILKAKRKIEEAVRWCRRVAR